MGGEGRGRERKWKKVEAKSIQSTCSLSCFESV